MSLDQALAVVKAAGYRITAPRVRKPVRVARLNAVGKPYSPQYDPAYKRRTPLTSIARLRGPQNGFPWVGSP